MKIAMANDHAGTKLKNEIKAYLESEGHEVKDFGTYDEESCDLSDFVYPAALAVVCQDPFCAALARHASTTTAMCSASAARSSDRRLPWRSSRPGCTRIR